MKTLFVAFFVGFCCFLSACKGHNNLEKHKEVVAVRRLFDEEIEKINSQLELADPGATSEAVVYKNLGASYLEQGKLDKAVVAFKKAVQIAPSFVEAHYLLADVYSLKGEGILSRQFLDRAMALDGSYIIDTMIRIVDETHIIVEPPGSAVIESEESIKRTFPPEFFEDPDKVGVPREWGSPPK